MKTYPVNTLAYAADYREPVTIVAIERKARGATHALYTVRRLNGATTANYPGYLLLEMDTNAACARMAERRPR